MKAIRHPWNLQPIQAIKLQKELSKKILLKNDFGKIKIIAGADVGFDKEGKKVFGGMVVFIYPEMEILESVRVVLPVKFPYIPGLLSFREGPVLMRTYAKLKTKPDLIIFDGQGIAHPRGLGIASHMGLILNKPTIGSAKSWLYGEFKKPGEKRGDYSYLYNKEKKKIGAVLRTRSQVNPIFVSPGHKINIKTSINIILTCSPKYRIPEPIRQSHQLAHFTSS